MTHIFLSLGLRIHFHTDFRTSLPNSLLKTPDLRILIIDIRSCVVVRIVVSAAEKRWTGRLNALSASHGVGDCYPQTKGPAPRSIMVHSRAVDVDGFVTRPALALGDLAT